MKYKYPKKVTIGSTEFKIIYDYKNDDGAEFSYPHDGESAFIRFALREHKNNPIRFFAMIIHEVKEILAVEQSTRFYKRGDDNFVFFMIIQNILICVIGWQELFLNL